MNVMDIRKASEKHPSGQACYAGPAYSFGNSEGAYRSFVAVVA
jgi:hypothetical protein